jgi:hypothetical protein
MSNCRDQERKRHEEEYNRTLLSRKLFTDVNLVDAVLKL